MHRAVTSLIVLLLLSGPGDAADRVRVGVELTFFQAAAPIATALAAGQIDVGATGLTAALYNIVLGGERLWIVADNGREWPSYPVTAIVVQKDVRDLKGRRIGVTELGAVAPLLRGKQVIKELNGSSARPSGAEVPRR